MRDRTTRRRFLKICAYSAITTPIALSNNTFVTNTLAPLYKKSSSRTTFNGYAFGGDICLILDGNQEKAKAVRYAVFTEIERLEKIFSLYRTDSEIVQLNRLGVSNNPSPEMIRLLQQAQDIYILSGKLFDPTVQSVFDTVYNRRASENMKDADKKIDFSHIIIDTMNGTIDLKGKKITLNGIAQGFASDLIGELLRAYGFNHMLINIGEYVSVGESYSLLIENVLGHQLSVIDLKNNAVATSSADALYLPDGRSHLIQPSGEKDTEWKTVSVIAKNATIADGFSTAFSLMSLSAIQSLDFKELGIERILLEDFQHYVRTL